MKLPEMPSYPYIGQDWDDTARLLLEDWGKACYVAGEKQERALWELTKAGEALGEPAATPVVPPSGWRTAMNKMRKGRKYQPSYDEGWDDALDIAEQAIDALIAASPSPRTPEQPEQRPDSDHPVGE